MNRYAGNARNNERGRHDEPSPSESPPAKAQKHTLQTGVSEGTAMNAHSRVRVITAMLLGMAILGIAGCSSQRKLRAQLARASRDRLRGIVT
jgi:hypothetical protein